MASHADGRTPRGGSSLRERFDEYCMFGGTQQSQTPGLTNKNLAKMMKEAGQLDKKLTTTALDIIFVRVVERGAKKMSWPQFLAALEECAATKRCSAEEVRAAIVDGGGPKLTNASAVDAVRFHDDKALYTGVHKAGGPTNIDAVISLSNLADRTEADVRGVKKETPRAAATAATADRGFEKSPRPTRPAPPTPADDQGISVRDALLHASPRRPQSASPSVGRSVARSSPSSSAVDDASSRAASLSLHAPDYYQILTAYFRQHNPAKTANVGILLEQYAGREAELFAKMEAKYGVPVLATPKRKPTNIYDKLTDSSQYTGAHKHRFDAYGRGRGLAGRDVVAKGGGPVPRGPGKSDFDGNTNQKTDRIFYDSSQFLMR